MSTLGQKPATTHVSFQKQTITGNGGTSYTLQQSVGSELDIAVFINNTRQEPTTAYTASGTSLVMTGAVNSSDNFYVIFLAKAINTTGLPVSAVNTASINANAVTMDKLATSGTLPALDGSALTGVSQAGITSSSTSGTAISIDSSNRVTLPLQPIAHTYFGDANQDGAYNAGTSRNGIVIKPNLSHVNVGNMYNSSTGRYTVPVAGKYVAFFSGSQYNNGVNNYHRVNVRKNGTAQKSHYNNIQSGSSNWTHMDAFTIFNCAANDYIDFFNVCDGETSNSNKGGFDTNLYTVFGVYLLA